MHNLYAHDGRFRRTELFFIRWALRYFDKIIVHCHKARKSAVKTYKLIPNKSNKFFVIPHGSYIDVYNNMTSREDARSKLGLDSEHTVLLFLGQLREYKGIDQLIEAFSSIPEKNIRLILAGKCPREDLLYKIQEAKKKDSRILIYPKFIPEDEIQIYMNATDIVVLPFTNVLTSGSMILGMSFGKAIIAPKMGCIPETIANKGGVLYDPDDPNGLKNAIAFIIEKNVGDMGRRNFEVVQNIPWDVVAKKTMLLYKKP